MPRSRPDANQTEIVAALKGSGIQVIDLHEVGMDVPDLLITARGRWLAEWVARTGFGNVLLEVKTERGKLSPGQRAFHASWLGPICTVRTVAEALEVAGIESRSIDYWARNIAQSARRGR